MDLRKADGIEVIIRKKEKQGGKNFLSKGGFGSLPFAFYLFTSSLSSSSCGACASSIEGIVSVAGTVYSSLAQRPKSISLQRSEQKGRFGLSCHPVGFPQFGHFIIKAVSSPWSVVRCLFSVACALKIQVSIAKQRTTDY
jgi:hypothetical protein